ncbi:MAG: hypothetical protein WD827_00280 [Solirubrobacterales bacterium]
MDEPTDQGPFLIVAALAPQAAFAPDGRITGISGITNHIQIGNQGSDQMPAMRLKLQAVLLLVAGPARGKSFTVAIQPQGPSGKRLLREDFPFEFRDHEQAPASITIEMHTKVDEEGLHWFDVILAPRLPDGEERLLTRMPLEISYQRGNSQ